MKTPLTLLAGAALALAFLAGVALAPSFVAPAAAQLFGGPVTQLVARGGHGVDVMTAAATHIGITVDQLRTELQAGKSMTEVAVANGKTREGLIAAIQQAQTSWIEQLVDQKGYPAGPGLGRRHGIGFGYDLHTSAASYLGITTDELATKARSGQSLADIANATGGMSRDGLIQALVADATKAIDQAQADGKITADRATQLKSDLAERITSFVDATRPMGFGPRGFGPGGFGFRGWR